MSYCRWSSDDYQCDVYCYESVDGFEIHVAGQRYDFSKFKMPRPLSLPCDPVELLIRDKKIRKLIKKARLKSIGLPYDGQSFIEDTAGDAADRLEELKKLGYNLPQRAIDMLREEEEESHGRQ